MRSLPLILLAVWLIMGMFVRDWFGCNEDLATANAARTSLDQSIPVQTALVKGSALSLTISDGSAFTVSSEEQIRFRHSESKHLLPRAQQLTSALSKTAAYLVEHPDKLITLTGLYQIDEKNETKYANLGLARANDLKKVLNGLGVSSDKILIAGTEVSQLAFENKVVSNALRFKISNVGFEGSHLSAIDRRLKRAPQKIYFKSNDEAILLEKSLFSYFDDLMYYLEKNPTAQVLAIGHTDGHGDRKNNIALGKRRAEYVRDYLIQKGVNPKQIITSSAGPDKPVASNNTALGRTKNRRVELTIK